MEYAVLMYEDEGIWEAMTPEEQEAVFAAHGAFAEAVAAGGGRIVDGLELAPTGAARSLRWDGSVADVVDGPFVESVEHLGGLYLITAPDLDRVLEWAQALPHDAEIRPTVVEGDPEPVERDAPQGVRVLALLYGDEKPWAEADEATRAAVYAAHQAFADHVVEAGGAVVGGRELSHSESATTLRRTGGGWAVSDGPFAEAVEQLGGFYVLDVPDMACAEAVMHRLPGGVTELRPVQVR